MAETKVTKNEIDTTGTVVSLYSGTKNTTGTITIGDISSYRFIIVKIKAGSMFQSSIIVIPVIDISYGDTDAVSYQIGILESSTVNCYVKFTFTNGTTLNVRALGQNTWGAPALTNVYGIK